MKKLVFGLIATVLLAFNSNAQKDSELLQNLDVKKAAEIHNEILSQLEKDMANDKSLTLKEAFLNLKVNDVSQDQLATIYENVSKNSVEENYKFVLEKLSSKEAKDFYAGLNTTIEKNDNFDKLISILNQKENEANNLFKGSDLKVIQLFIETSKASADYWYNISPNAATIAAKGGWIRKDGNGIAQASIGWAVIAAATSGPAAPWTYFAGCAIGGALASIWPD